MFIKILLLHLEYLQVKFGTEIIDFNSFQSSEWNRHHTIIFQYFAPEWNTRHLREAWPAPDCNCHDHSSGFVRSRLHWVVKDFQWIIIAIINSMVTLVETAGFCPFWLTPNVFKINSIQFSSPGVTLLKGYKKRFALCKKRLLLNFHSKKIHYCLGQFRSSLGHINLDKHYWHNSSFDRFYLISSIEAPDFYSSGIDVSWQKLTHFPALGYF